MIVNSVLICPDVHQLDEFLMVALRLFLRGSEFCW